LLRKENMSHANRGKLADCAENLTLRCAKLFEYGRAMNLKSDIGSKGFTHQDEDRDPVRPEIHQTPGREASRPRSLFSRSLPNLWYGEWIRVVINLVLHEAVFA